MSKFGLCTRHRYEGGFCADCGRPKPAPWSVRLAAWWTKRRAAKKRRRAKQGPDYSCVRPPPVDREPAPTPAPPPKQTPTLLDLITCQCCGAVPQFPDLTCKACREHNRSAAVDALRRANCEIDRLKAIMRLQPARVPTILMGATVRVALSGDTAIDAMVVSCSQVVRDYEFDQSEMEFTIKLKSTGAPIHT